MRLIFLGTGTSTGVPQLNCNCEVCRSTDPADSRMRASAIVEVGGKNILIDCGPDFREQMLRFHRQGDLDALLVTHQHYDHVGGADDLRPYCKGKDAFPVYCQEEVAHDLRMRMPYCFVEHPYPGVPRYDIHIISPLKPFRVGDISVMPLPVNHFRLEIVGFRIGNLAYITDAKRVPDATRRGHPWRGYTCHQCLAMGRAHVAPHYCRGARNHSQSIAAQGLYHPSEPSCRTCGGGFSPSSRGGGACARRYGNHCS